MSLDQKVGQLFILGFPQSSLTKELTRTLKKLQPGAFVLFKRNIPSLASVKKLNEDLYNFSEKYSGLPPLIAVDQEGGNVVRISTSPPMPNALSIGQTGSADIAFALGQESGKVLHDLGFNMNLAPVLDIANPFAFSFIGLRSFGSDPEIVSRVGFHFSKGMILGGVVPTAKHFPGTGSSSTDPHHESSTVLTSADELQRIHLPPFQRYSHLGFFTALMVSHSIYPDLDPTKTPAVFSPAIMTDLLRKKLNYRGLIITDDLQMSASRSFLRPEEAVLQSLKAGSDMVMLTWSAALQERAVARVKAAVKSGELSMAVLDDKVQRITKVKKFIVAPQVALRSLASMTNLFPSEKMQIIDDEVLSANLKRHLDAVEKTHQKLCVFSSSAAFLKSFKSEYGSAVITNQISRTSLTKDLESAFKARRCDLLVYTVEGKRTAGLLNAFSKKLKAKTLVANMNLPVFVSQMKDYRTVLNIYFPHRNAGKKIAQLLKESYAINSL